MDIEQRVNRLLFLGRVLERALHEPSSWRARGAHDGEIRYFDVDVVFDGERIVMIARSVITDESVEIFSGDLCLFVPCGPIVGSDVRYTLDVIGTVRV